MAGYSGTPLPQKLGIKPGARVALLGAPPGFARVLGALPAGAKVENALAARTSYDVIVLFTTSAGELARRFSATRKCLDPNGGFWVAWPKKASGVTTDVTEDTVRGIALEAGLVDNKVCAIDETWSGLRNVVRLADRPQGAKPKPSARSKTKTPSRK
jgi:hypothetical protein